VLLLIAEDGWLAARAGAAGLHLPERARGRLRYWRQRRPRWLITVAAHGLPALRAAAEGGADAALLAPVFPTASHPGAPALGPLRFARLAQTSPLPVYALGGVTARTGRRLSGTAAAGIAAITALAGD
ncbi:MAG: thiamine phosphate synthase, partial [Alphaproteobacteria bacterium]|nr:thiamine phosphate synthase [Alphaproteobacteria bacterium]